MRDDLEIVYRLEFQLARAKQAHSACGSVALLGTSPISQTLATRLQGVMSRGKTPGGSRTPPPAQEKGQLRGGSGPKTRFRAEFAQQAHCFTSTVYLLRLALVGVRWGRSLKPPKGNTWHSYSFGVFTVMNPGIEEWLLENLPCVRS